MKILKHFSLGMFLSPSRAFAQFESVGQALGQTIFGFLGFIFSVIIAGVLSRFVMRYIQKRYSHRTIQILLGLITFIFLFYLIASIVYYYF